MARGDIITLASGASTLRPTADTARSIVLNNRNNGNVYVAADELPDTHFFDYIVGPYNTARLPGLFRETVGLYYQDLSGAGVAGQIEWYRSAMSVDAPEYGPIGSAVQTSFANVDLAQVATPGPPASGFSRLFASAVDQQLWYELPSGVLIPVSQQTKLQLDSVAGSDIFNNTALVLNVWTDIIIQLNFQVDDANSIVQAILDLGMAIVEGAGAGEGAVSINVDSSGTRNPPVKTWFAPANGETAVGGGSVCFTGLAAGAHTMGVRYIASAAASAYLRCGSQPNFEFLRLQVLEHKR